MRKNIYQLSMMSVTLLMVSVFIGGCGGDSDTIGAGASAGVSSGVIQGFGSIIVNGITFETEGVEVEAEGVVNATTDDLQEGMVVEVEGTFNADGTSGTATKVKFEDDLEGPITSVTTSGTGLVKTLVIMGQTVIVESGLTQFDDNDPTFTFASLGAGNVSDVVEVSGLRKPMGPSWLPLSRRTPTTWPLSLPTPITSWKSKGPWRTLRVIPLTSTV